MNTARIRSVRIKSFPVFLPVLLVILCLCGAGFAAPPVLPVSGHEDELSGLLTETDYSDSDILSLWNSFPERIRKTHGGTVESDYTVSESLAAETAGSGIFTGENSVVLELAGILTDIENCTGVSSAATLEEFAGLVALHAARLEDSFTVPCAPSVIEQLKKTVDYKSDVMFLREILSVSGVCGSYHYTWLDDGVRLSGITYYPGWRILRAWRNGSTETLSARERDTLAEALALAAGASGTDLEKERYIYDELCARVTYDNSEDPDEGPLERDGAVGALLSGRADCDGYADAMVLCCRIAGVPCRYMHGDSREQPDDESADILHMWNLVRIDGTWLMADATWGDKEETRYLFFNLGKEDASASYVWCPETLFTDVADTADFSRHLMADQQPATVRTMDDVYTAVRSAVTAGMRRLTLYCPERILWETDPDTLNDMICSGAVQEYSYDQCGRLYEIFGLTLPDIWWFCDSESEMLSALDTCATRKIRSFSLYFSPSLSRSLFAGDKTRLRQLLSLSRLAEPHSYTYWENSCHIALEDAIYIAPLPVCSSAGDVAALIRRELPSRPVSLTFLLRDGLSFSDIRDEMWQAVYSMGVSDTGGSTIFGSRIRIEELVYYPDYCLASSEADISSYLKAAKKTGKTSVRCYCPDSLYQSLFANNASRFFALLKQAGFSHYSVRYNEAYGLLYAEDLR